MSQVVVTDDVIVASETTPGFSWPAVLAGALVASGTILFLLMLGSGIGLSLFTVPEVDANEAANGVTLGAIYFFASQAFGLAVGGYLAGRLMGPVLESESEEIFHASAHGLVVWAVGVVLTAAVVMLSGLVLTASGINAAATMGAASSNNQSTELEETATGYWVDTLFRPSPSGVAAAPVSAAPAVPGAITSAPSTVQVVTPPSGRSEAEARAEAGRILTVGLIGQDRLSMADRDRLASLVSQYTGDDPTVAAQRVDEVQTRIQQQKVTAAEAARKLARNVSLWLAASLVFGAMVSSAAAVSGRWVDDKARAA